MMIVWDGASILTWVRHSVRRNLELEQSQAICFWGVTGLDASPGCFSRCPSAVVRLLDLIRTSLKYEVKSADVRMHMFNV